MTDYTPTTEEIIEHWAAVRGQSVDPVAHDRHLARAEMFRRWLAAHDAEKRAEWEAEQGEAEWEYAQGFVENEEGDWYIGKSFGDDATRELDEGYSLVRRRLGPWELVERGDDR